MLIKINEKNHFSIERSGSGSQQKRRDLLLHVIAYAAVFKLLKQFIFADLV